MNSITTVFTIVFSIFIFLFPIWVAVHSWRKGFKPLAIAIGIGYFIPFLPAVIALVAFFIVKPYHPNLDYIPNPRLYIGWGTKFYCSSKKNEDGSFLTTQWFTAFYIPLVPIQSYRILMGEEHYKWYGYSATTTQYFEVLECKKLENSHLYKVYLFLLSFVFIVPLVALYNKFSYLEHNPISVFFWMFLVGYFVAGYFLLRPK
jgi:hypothetical protein